LTLNHFKKAKKNILAPPYKRKRFKKNPLPINNLAKALVIYALPNIQKGVNNARDSRERSMVKLPKNAIKANIIQRRASARVSRKRTVILPPKNAYKTNTIRNNVLNYYSGSKKDLAELGLTANDQGGRKDHYITKG